LAFARSPVVKQSFWLSFRAMQYLMRMAAILANTLVLGTAFGRAQ
jgi:hypothetical protein